MRLPLPLTTYHHDLVPRLPPINFVSIVEDPVALRCSRDHWAGHGTTHASCKDRGEAGVWKGPHGANLVSTRDL